LTWDEGSSNGGSPILEYRIWMAIQGEEFEVLQTLVFSDYLVTGLTAGVTYEFKIQSRSQYDYSEDSATLVLLCATEPDTPISVVTAIEGD
jgi:hypothetical protein